MTATTSAPALTADRIAAIVADVAAKVTPGVFRSVDVVSLSGVTATVEVSR